MAGWRTHFMGIQFFSTMYAVKNKVNRYAKIMLIKAPTLKIIAFPSLPNIAAKRKSQSGSATEQMGDTKPQWAQATSQLRWAKIRTPQRQILRSVDVYTWRPNIKMMGVMVLGVTDTGKL
jgi:hypothetical protein